MRLHLASHGVTKFLFKCDIKDKVVNEIRFPSEKKKELHEEAINCINEDGLPFNIFMKPGMKKLVTKDQIA